MRTECINGHELTPENTYTYPSGYRACRSCQRFYNRIKNVRRRAEGRMPPVPLSYYRQYRREVTMGLRTPQPRKSQGLTITARILDLLETEKSWMVPFEIADRLSVDVETVRTTLTRLRVKSKVESRRVNLNDRDFRTEWRYLILQGESV